MVEGGEKVATIYQILMKFLSRDLYYKTMYKLSVRENGKEKVSLCVYGCVWVCVYLYVWKQLKKIKHWYSGI